MQIWSHIVYGIHHEPITAQFHQFGIHLHFKLCFIFYLEGGEFFSVSFVVSLGLGDCLTDGRFRYSNSEVTETVDFVFKLILERGETKVTLIGILR